MNGTNIAIGHTAVASEMAGFWQALPILNKYALSMATSSLEAGWSMATVWVECKNEI